MTDAQESRPAYEPVEVWNEFSRRWTRGFMIVERVVNGYLLRRAGDHRPLPVPIPAERVRPALGR